MPQLQNNNRVPVKVNDGNAPKSNSYINEVEAVNNYNVPSNTAMALGGIGNIMNNLSEKLQDFSFKTQQIETENKFNEYQIESNNLTKEYKFNYQRQPSEELTKVYEHDMENLKTEYEKQIPGLFKDNFLQRIDIMAKQNDLNFFRKSADLNYQSQKYLNTLNESLNTINRASYEGNFEAMENEINTLSIKKEQPIALYGDIKGNEIYNNHVKGLIKNYMGGRIAANNPNDVLDIANVIALTPEFSDKLTAEEMEHYKQLAIDKKNKLDKARRTQEETEYAIKTNLIINDIANEKLNNYEDIINRLLETGTDEYESKLILKFADYSTTLPPELLNRNRENNKKPLVKKS